LGTAGGTTESLFFSVVFSVAAAFSTLATDSAGRLSGHADTINTPHNANAAFASRSNI
jgi:hypothetical protein